MQKLGFVLGVLLALSMIGAALAEDTPLMVGKSDQLGSFLTDSKGMTLYMFGKDTPGVSNCYDACAKSWPALLTTGAATLPAGTEGTLATTSRKDGTTQVTYNGWPLYYFANDKAPGDTKGQGLGKVWFVVAPAATTALPVAAAAAVLPKTGGLPIEPVILVGVALLAVGERLRRR